MIEYKVSSSDKFTVEDLVKRIFWLAFQSASVSLTSTMNENHIFDVISKRDNNYYADYLGTRMIKLNVKVNGDSIQIMARSAPNIEYQSWCSKYPTYEDLILNAVESLS